MNIFDGPHTPEMRNIQRDTQELKREMGNLPRGQRVPSSSGNVIYRMKVIAINIDDNPNLVRCERVGVFVDRTYLVKAIGKAVDDEILVTRPEGDTDETFNGKTVVWQDVSGGNNLPVPTAHRQVIACTRFVSAADYDVAFTFLEATTPA